MTHHNRTTSFVILAAAAMAAFAFTAANSAQAQLFSEFGVLDLNANGGINPATSAPWQLGDQYRLTFVTSQSFTATSTDINDYNNFVQGVANSSSLGLGSATWNVIAATDFVDARTNTGTNLGPVGEATFLMDGSTIFANNYADLWNGTAMESPGLFAAPDLNEEGNFLSVSRVFTGSNNGLNTGFRQLGDVSGVTETGTNQPNNNQRWLIQFNQTQTNPSSFYALSDPLTVTDMSPPVPETPVVLLSTDFSGRVVTGDTASNITWVTNGIADPGSLTAVDINNAAPGTFALFDTANAQGHFAPDLNVQNEGPWSVDIPIAVEVSSVEVEQIVLDWQHFNNGGAFQSAGINRPVDWEAELIGSVDGLVGSVTGNVGSGGFGVLELDFPMLVELTDDQSWILRLTADQPTSSGNNTGLDAINVFGFINVAAVPEPASIAIWSLIGLGLAGFGYYRVRRKK